MIYSSGVTSSESHPGRWVLFSDLHLSDRSLDTCLEVLEAVHAVAERQGCPVAFLGDWWDIRGALPVRSLNATMEALRQWSVPLWMIPGNHDQISIDGLTHGLSVYDELPGVTVVDEPERHPDHLDLLMVPYRRDHQEVVSAIARHRQGLRAVFAHVDTVGARMNGHRLAKSGIQVSDVPDGVTLYTGHYHGAHGLARDGSIGPDPVIVYIGSLWQVSAAEEGQEKAILTVGGPHYEVIARDVVDIGRRHHTVHDEWPDDVRPGDRVIYHCQEDPELPGHDGITVDIRKAPKAAIARISNEESADPIKAWEKFSAASNFDKSFIDSGLELLREVTGAAS
jgi:DNA repair exonuclease SbcCD nuclease subunit